MSSVTVRNCIKFYQTAEDINAELLKQHCSELISNHWVRFYQDIRAELLKQNCSKFISNHWLRFN